MVLKAEKAGIEACQVGSPWNKMHRVVSEVIAQGLIELGVLECSLQEALGDETKLDGPFRNFFMHGTGHLLGLDVHDVGGGRQGDPGTPDSLEPGMVLTIEPGLYFADWREDIEMPERPHREPALQPPWPKGLGPDIGQHRPLSSNHHDQQTLERACSYPSR